MNVQEKVTKERLEVLQSLDAAARLLTGGVDAASWRRSYEQLEESCNNADISRPGSAHLFLHENNCLHQSH